MPEVTCKRPWPAIKVDPRFADAVFVVEANSYERLCLWRENEGRDSLTWEQGSGWLITVGHLGPDKPVCIEIGFDKIGGKWVVFYDATSRVVDWEIVEKWFADNFWPTYGGGRRAHCNAMSFGRCLSVIEGVTKIDGEDSRTIEVGS